MSNNTAALISDLRRASYFFQDQDMDMAKMFLARSLEKYVMPENLRALLNKAKTDNHLKAAERVMTVSLLL